MINRLNITQQAIKISAGLNSHNNLLALRVRKLCAHLI